MGGKPDQWEKGQMYVSDLNGYLGPKCKGSKAVQHDLVECLSKYGKIQLQDCDLVTLSVWI